MRAERRRDGSWEDVCSVDDLLPNTGVACLVSGHQVALFRVGSEHAFYAVDNFDPFSRANVIARGIVGCRSGRPKVASPMYKQSFCLQSGACLDDPSVSLEVFQVSVEGRRVLVRASATHKLRFRNPELVSDRGA